MSISSQLGFALRTALTQLAPAPGSTSLRHLSTRQLLPVASSSRSHSLAAIRTAHMAAYSHSTSSEHVPLVVPAEPDVKGKGREASPIGASIPAKQAPKRRPVALKAKKAAITVVSDSLIVAIGTNRTA